MRKLKKGLSLALALFIVFSEGIQVFASDYSESDVSGYYSTEDSIPNEDYLEVENAYIKYSRLCELNEIAAIPFEDFLAAFEASDCKDAALFLKGLMEELVSNDATVAPDPDAEVNLFDDAWYFNTGTRLPRAAKYSSYNLLSLVKKGDIIYETRGGMAPIAGHISIVEGVFWSSSQNQFYIRLVEAISSGVRRSVFDEERLSDKGGTILRVTSATDSQRSRAVDFCISQLGKGYSLHTPKHSASNSDSWYCSELVWAAYKQQSIELHPTPSAGEVFPADLYSSSKTFTVAYSSTKPASRLTDISSHWAKSSITYLVNNGVMTGRTSTTFSPNAKITRMEFVMAMYKLAGCPSASATHCFNDTSGLSYLELMAIKWAANASIVNGNSDGSFNPNGVLTREQFAALLYRYALYAGLSTSYNSNALSGYSDASSVSSFAVIPMKWAVSKGIITGSTSTTLSPSLGCERCQSATMLKRFIDKCM